MKNFTINVPFANKLDTKTSRGFTLVEALVAIAIISLSVAGPLVTANRAIIAAQNARQQLTASYLAQEGIEYVRAMRDNEYLIYFRLGGANISSLAWNEFISGSSPASITQCRSATCLFDPSKIMGTGNTLSLNPCSGVACTPLRLETIANGQFAYTQQGGGTVTPFTRTIQVVDVIDTVTGFVNPNEVRVVSTVSWRFHTTPYSVTIVDHLTSWQ